MSRLNTASTAPAAVNVWPIIDLLEDIGMLRMCSPKTVETPRRFHFVVLGRRGAVGVDVVDVLGPTPASASALRMQAMTGLPSGLDRVRWNESDFSPQPSSMPSTLAPRATA